MVHGCSADVTECLGTESDPGIAGRKYSPTLHVVAGVVHGGELYILSEILYVFTYVVHCERNKLILVTLTSFSLEDALKNI